MVERHPYTVDTGVQFSNEVPNFARIAQSVEQRIENSCVGGSIPSPGTKCSVQHKFVLLFFKHKIHLILYNSVLIQRIQHKFSRGSPMLVRHIGLIAELSIQYLRGVS